MLTCALALAACGTTQEPSDVGADTDAGGGRDASATVDSGGRHDASTRPIDAAPTHDAPAPHDEGGGHDAPFPTDVGRTDAGRHCTYGGGCDLLAQDCPFGRACVPGPSASTCVDTGTFFPHQVGDPCLGPGECAPGSVCDLATSACESLACDPSDCVSPFWVYQALTDASGGTLPSGVGVCVQARDCTPVPNDCPDGYGCWPYPASNRCVRVLGTQPAGTLCDIGNECAPGLTCAGGTCEPICRLATPGDCPSGTACADIGLPRGFGICE